MQSIELRKDQIGLKKSDSNLYRRGDNGEEARHRQVYPSNRQSEQMELKNKLGELYQEEIKENRHEESRTEDLNKNNQSLSSKLNGSMFNTTIQMCGTNIKPPVFEAKKFGLMMQGAKSIYQNTQTLNASNMSAS